MSKNTLCKNFGFYFKRLLNSSSITQNLCVQSSSTLLYPKPTIQPKIKRSPTDILKALENTIGPDYNGPAYKFHDDPVLTPLTNFEKVTYSLSKESGRKAAIWVRDKHPDCFDHNPDDPIIEKFLPKAQFDENSDITEDDLLNSINSFQVTQAINMYEMSQNKSMELKDDTLLSLLELVCFYNCKDTLGMDSLEERNSLSNSPFDKPVKSWKDGGFAEKLFSSLKDKGSRPYCAIIKGMCKFYQENRAWELYQEALNNGIELDTETFNALIQLAPALIKEADLKWPHIQELLHKMVDLKIPPNLGTLNSIINAMPQIEYNTHLKLTALQVLTEFRNLNIQPSLGTYFALLQLFHPGRPNSSPLLGNILNTIEGTEFEIQDPLDTMFFAKAMKVCNWNLQSWELAQRVHKLLQHGKNYKFLGDNVRSKFYYREYLSLAVNSLPLSEFVEVYDTVVPHLFTQDHRVMEDIVQNIGVHDDMKLLPRVWSHYNTGVQPSWQVIQTVLSVINKPRVVEVDSTVASQLGDLVEGIWTTIQNLSDDKKKKFEFTGQMAGDMISILIKYGNVAKAAQIISKLNDEPHMCLGEVPLEALKIAWTALTEKQFKKEARMVVKYAKYINLPEKDVMEMQSTEAGKESISNN